MPISYKIDREQDLIYTKVSGQLTIKMTIEYFKCIQEDENIRNDAIEIVDFDNVDDFTISYSDMRIITQSFQTAKSKKHILGTIFMSKSDVAYGIARMLQTLHEIANKQHIVVVVRSDEELNGIINALRSDK